MWAGFPTPPQPPRPTPRGRAGSSSPPPRPLWCVRVAEESAEGVEGLEPGRGFLEGGGSSVSQRRVAGRFLAWSLVLPSIDPFTFSTGCTTKFCIASGPGALAIWRPPPPSSFLRSPELETGPTERLGFGVRDPGGWEGVCARSWVLWAVSPFCQSWNIFRGNLGAWRWQSRRYNLGVSGDPSLRSLKGWSPLLPPPRSSSAPFPSPFVPTLTLGGGKWGPQSCTAGLRGPP